MLGTFGVGKTSLVNRFVNDTFDEKYLSTIGVKVSQKTLEPAGNINDSVKFILWDIAHIEKINSVTQSYFRGAHAGIFVIDVSRSETMKQIDPIVSAFRDVNPGSVVAFVGNKVDMIEEDKIDMEQYLQLEKTYNTFFTLTSAKTGANVESLFRNLAELIIKAD